MEGFSFLTMYFRMRESDIMYCYFYIFILDYTNNVYATVAIIFVLSKYKF